MLTAGIEFCKQPEKDSPLFRSFLIFFCLLSIAAWAQESRGTIRGHVTDPTGAPVVGAAVEATSVNTGVAIRANTNQDGNYEVPYLLIGNYKVAVQSTGFRPVTREGIELRVNDHVTVDFSLALGAVSDSITVTGDAPLIDTASSTVGGVVDSKRVTELPNAGGNAFYMERFSAGVIMTGGHAPGNPTQDFVGGAFITAGVRPGHSDALVDGVTATSNGASTYMVPPQDMVEEFRVQTSTYDASAGRSAGALRRHQRPEPRPIRSSHTTVTSSAFGTVTGELGHGQRMVNFCWKVLF